MGASFSVRTIVLASGERLPLLLNSDGGIPLFEPTIYALTELRARNRASSTIDHALRAILVLCRFLDVRGIDLDARLDEGRLFQLHEIDDLARMSRLPLEAFAEGIDTEDGSRPSVRSRPLSLEKVRMQSPPPVPEIDPRSAALRLRYIRAYLRWLADYRLQRLEPSHPLHAGLVSESEWVIRVLGERIPSVKAGDFAGEREGLAPKIEARLNQVIDPSSPDNPWVSAHARARNYLIVKWLQSLGLRKGELLGIRISNIDFQALEVRVTRNADDPDDPRVRQPTTKTRGRLLPLAEDLARLTHDYIVNLRRQFDGAGDHDFLFVANGSGAPLTLGGVDKIFSSLREKCPDLPENLSPHIFRHTWNDRFSELMDANRVSEETEKKTRARLMGWSETSDTAATYTKRHVQRAAERASLDLQRKMWKRGKSK